MISLVNFISRKLEEFLVARVKTIPNVEANSGLVNAVGKEYAGKKALQICLRYAMIVGLL